MADLNLYLVPRGEPRPQRRVRQKVLKYLERRGVLDGLYDDDLGWFAPGPKSSELFAYDEGEGVAFEYAILYDKPRAHFVPDSHSGEFGSKCKSCRAKLDDRLYEFLTNEADGKRVKDPTKHAITCPKCKHRNRLVGLNTKISTAVTRFYLSFGVVEGYKLSPSVLTDLEGIVGSPLYEIYERI